MEVLGAIASAISILDLAQKINGLRVAASPSEMQRKTGSNTATVYRQSPAFKMSSRPFYPSVLTSTAFSFKSKGNRTQYHSQLSANWRKYFTRTLKGLKFALDKAIVASMLQSVEQARHHLHMALTLASLHTSTTWQSKAGSLLNEIKADMAKHSKVLERLENSGRLRQATLDLDTQADLCHDGGLPSSNEPAENASTPGGCPKKKCPPGSRLLPRPGRVSFRKKKRQNALEIIPSSYRESPRHAEASGHSAQQGVKHGDDGGHDADDDSGDDEEPLSQDIVNAGTRETSRNIPHEPEYVLVSTNGKLVQVPVDSAMYRSVVSPPDSENSHAYATDVETTTSEPRSPITIGSHRESHILISKTVNLALCRADARSTFRKFCTERVSITDKTQTFCVIEPCADQRRPRCRHITMEIEDGEVFAAEGLPCKIQLAFFCVGEPSSDALNDSSSRRDDSVASFSGSRCRDLARGCRRLHTVFDQDDRAECALPVELFASPQVMTDDSDATAERAPSEVEDDVDETEHDQHEEQGAHDAGFPTNPDPDDDERAFDLLRMIILDDTYKPPRNIEWEVLIRFLSLIDKYSQHVGDKPLNQAKFWASLIQPSETFDRNAVPWLWIMWKLRMGPEFRKLSSTIQRQARSPISHWQDGPENEYGIKLPELILSSIVAGDLIGH
ncbi:hypothetical protein QBC46DRAFT_348562 [Diplogelasinospora grovesii]|uniref:Uncharacterized protein n=1 Tax=Diplogelasinospora grovesii TaxID=303347 RepID=A0AAN6MVV2_9PEZI|nr:hypothetical protein QBC46DRAFT_348562 [Diplogelasinospora grovesii]